MSEAKRTPGEITLDLHGVPAIYETNSPTGHIICLFDAHWRSPEENAANAKFFHLAATSHDDLLAALKHLTAAAECWCKHLGPDGECYRCQSIKAIAKAEGRAK